MTVMYALTLVLTLSILTRHTAGQENVEIFPQDSPLAGSAVNELDNSVEHQEAVVGKLFKYFLPKEFVQDGSSQVKVRLQSKLFLTNCSASGCVFIGRWWASPLFCAYKLSLFAYNDFLLLTTMFQGNYASQKHNFRSYLSVLIYPFLQYLFISAQIVLKQF